MSLTFEAKGSLGVYPNVFPEYATSDSAAMDLRAAEGVLIQPGQILKVPTGVAIWAGSAQCGSKRIVGLVAIRSSFGKKGLTLANSLAIIDEDYQGELLCYVVNNSKQAVTIGHGERFAQVMYLEVQRVALKSVTEFSSSTTRGEGGFGSTGS